MDFSVRGAVRSRRICGRRLARRRVRGCLHWCLLGRRGLCRSWTWCWRRSNRRPGGGWRGGSRGYGCGVRCARCRQPVLHSIRFQLRRFQRRLTKSASDDVAAIHCRCVRPIKRKSLWGANQVHCTSHSVPETAPYGCRRRLRLLDLRPRCRRDRSNRRCRHSRSLWCGLAELVERIAQRRSSAPRGFIVGAVETCHVFSPVN